MSPSRGFNLFFRRGLKIDISRPSTRHFSQFVQTAKNPSNKTQIYLSRNLDPILNLSIEHYLLQKTPEDSTVLFLYTNKPCVVIGRNQNPWVEVNFSAIQSSKEPIRLVRRRSGGGTVFHDLGNVNYSVICPTAAFDRDKHAEMVVRALHKLGVDTTRVNKRHDIVLDRTEATGEKKALKVSGSAYKLTRLRSLHHGTCLLNSPNLGEIGKYLRPVAKHSIEARGVESVSSPVTNVNVPNAEFEQAVISEFLEMYGASDPITVSSSEDAMRVPEIEKGYDELKSADWIYGQTPQFTFSNPQIDPKVWHQPSFLRMLSGPVLHFLNSSLNANSYKPSRYQ